MFIQVIQGKTTDRAKVKASMDRWVAELAPGATGWLGTTGGVTADGTLIACARFESAEAAKANSDRPEQHQWWMETSKLFAGEAVFHDCMESFEFLRGGSDDAGFVQVMQGQVTDAARIRELMSQGEDSLRQMRPDVIGGTIAFHGDDGGFTEPVYFTSEAAAREGESQEAPPEATAMMEEMGRLMPVTTYLDLSEPWLFSPR